MLGIPVPGRHSGAPVHVSQERVCVDCREFFVITPATAAWFTSKHMALPRRCHVCLRNRRRRESLESRGYTVYDTDCSQCGGRTVVPFQPDGSRTVLCPPCYVAANSQASSEGEGESNGA